MDQEIIRLLKSSNPTDRIEGVNRLVASGHADTVKILGALYKKETDNLVRQVVADAARSIKQKRDRKRATSEMLALGMANANPNDAKEFLERATHYLISFQLDEAWMWAKKAFQTNPTLVDDEYAIGVAAEITGADRSIAVETLLTEHGFGTSEKPKRGTKAKVGVSDRIGWGRTLVWIFLMALVSGLVTFIPTFYLAERLIQIGVASDSTLTNVDTSMPTLIFVGLIIAVFVMIVYMVSTLIQLALIHFSALTMLGGDGFYTNLVYKMRFPIILQVLIIGGLVAFAFVGFISEFPTDPRMIRYLESTGDYTVVPALMENAMYGLGMLFIAALASLCFSIWMSYVIGKVYNIGSLKGCGSILLAGFLMNVLNVGCNYIFAMMFAQ